MPQKLLLVSLAFLFISQQVIAQGTPIRTEAKIDQVKEQYALSGDGVLTIMMDRGIDYRHPDFIDENGDTRIAYIYDLYDDTGANDPDNPFGVGTIFDSTEINAALQAGGAPLTNDLFGHGTATTGIMSGNGRGVSTSDQFSGVADQAKIISIVVTKDFVPPFGNNPGQPGQFNPSLFSFAFQFAEAKSEELDLPSVTLLNIGSIGDPTDGSIELCDLIDDYVNNGNTFVCGTGDDGGKDNHMITTLAENETTELSIEKGEVGFLRFTAWYAEADRFDLTIQRPSGEVLGPFSPPSNPNDAQDNFLNQISVFHRGSSVEFANSAADLRQLLIDFTGEVGTYTISLSSTNVSNNGRVNAFLNPALFNNNNSFLNNDNPGGNINSYSACPASISPGDYVATSNWVDVNGINRMKVNEGAPGELWVGSSIGPTMDDRLGIDFVAPGEIGWAAYGEGSFYSNFDFNVLENSQGFYGLQTAVSAAAPTTAGLIALMLELDPTLTPEEIKSILQNTAREDAFTGVTPNEQWGHGKLDALAAIDQVFQLVNVDESIQNEHLVVRLSPNPAGDFVNLSFLDTPPSEYTVQLFSTNGQLLREYLTPQSGIDLTGMEAGLYLLKIMTNEVAMLKRLIKQ